MRDLIIRAIFASGILLVLHSTTPSSIHGQASTAQPPQRTLITVALVDSLPRLRNPYPALVVRTPGESGRDVILLPRASANGVVLDQAVRVLLDARARERAGKARLTRPDAVVTLGVRGEQASPEWAVHHVPLAQQVVNRLLDPTTKQQTIAGVGFVPALEFMPPKAPRRTANR